MPIIGIDASRSTRLRKSGVARYSFEIIREVLAQAPADWQFRLYAEEPSGTTGDGTIDDRTIRVGVIHELPLRHVLRWPPKFLWTQTRLAWEVLVHPPQLLFVPGHVLPIFHSRPAVTTIHDVAFLTHPQAYTWYGRLYLGITTALAVRTADRLIVPTEAVKKDVLHFYPGVAGLADRIRVIPHGVSAPPMVSEGECAAVRAKYGVRQPYAIMIGRIERKKNVGRALAAINEVRKERPDVEMVLIGRPLQGYEEEMAGAGLPRPAWVRELGALEDRDTYALLQGAAVLIFPSLAEGFGLPILEAFHYGVPVVTSRGGATEEVAGGCAELVDPMSSDDIARGIKQALQESAGVGAYGRTPLQARIHHAAQFTWQKAGAATVAVLRELLNNTPV